MRNARRLARRCSRARKCSGRSSWATTTNGGCSPTKSTTDWPTPWRRRSRNWRIARRLHKEGKAEAAEAFSRGLALVRGALAETRRLIADLRSPAPEISRPANGRE